MLRNTIEKAVDSQMYPPVEASGGQEQYYVRSSWHLRECNWESSGQSDVSLAEASGGQEWYEIPM